MNLTDPIADMLTRIRNANSVNKATVSMPSSKKLVEIARVLHEEGYGPKKQKVINGIRRISKPGLRKYTGVADMPRVRGGLGTAIISTSHGVMTDRDARKHNVGGEIIAYVW